MSKVLGLDLGTNSIGWAIVDEGEKIILGVGSRIFPAGVNELGKGESEVSKNASRTQSRGIRKQHFRRRLRKRLLLRELTKNGLCPVQFKQVSIWSSNEVFESIEFKNWVKLNPYELRARAVKEKIDLYELGRIFYHLIQHRGFLSNSRNAGAQNNEKSVIFTGDPKTGKSGITETQKELKRKSTLGEYLNAIKPQENRPFKHLEERVRNRYTTRQMYIDEFEKIWSVQEKYYPELDHSLKTLIGGRKKEGYKNDGVLFHQRPLRSQKHLIGKCSFEPKKNKCRVSAMPFEEFRVYQWVNTVDCNNERLTDSDREALVKKLFSTEKTSFKALRKEIGKLSSDFQFNYKDDDKILGTYTISQLSSKKYFGKKWFNFSEKEQEDIWHVLLDFEDRDKLKSFALNKWGFSEESADQISKFNLKDGYGNLSLKAINNILPFLKIGYTYDKAVALGGVRNAFGNKWFQLSPSEKTLIVDTTLDIISESKKGGFIEQLKSFLVDEYGMNEKQLKKLYHHSATINKSKIYDKLPLGLKADKEIQSIRNPIVITALFELRKLVNTLIEEYGPFDMIKVEMARDLKISKTKRNAIRREQKRLERENDRIKIELNHLGQRITHVNILKYKLWEECNKTCPYTGINIGPSELFTNNVQIEHIQPWSRSLNDSFMNKTLCFANENNAKGNKTPYEFYMKQSKEKWEQVKRQALSCFKNKEHYPNAYAKFKQFVKTEFDDDFVSRQLNDTRYISKEAKNYLSKVCQHVQVSPGQVTSHLRHHWGLNSILNDENTKSRDDHRHHSIDALVLACTKQSYLQELSLWNKYDRAGMRNFNAPWPNFYEDAKMATNEILVSHKKSDRVISTRTSISEKKGVIYKNKGVSVRGQLHKESVFGKRSDIKTGKQAFHIRKPLLNLTKKKQIEKIVDPAIKKLIYKRIEEEGGFEKSDTIPKTAFFETGENGELIPKLFLPNKNGMPVPIKKVRMMENIGRAEQLKNNINQHVNPKNNHHVLIYRDEKGDLNEEVVTFWTAVERKKQGIPVIQLPNPEAESPLPTEIVASLQINDLFLLNLDDSEIDWEEPNYELLTRHLYRVQKLSSKFYEFRLHSEAKIDKKSLPYYARIQSFGSGKTGWLTYNPIPVKIGVDGTISRK